MRKLKIAVVVPGRFYGFDLAKSLIARGNDVTIFTNYPRFVVKKFGIESGRVRSFWLHGVLGRFIHESSQRFHTPAWTAFLDVLFGRWACSRLARDAWDVILSFSGTSEEIMTAFQNRPLTLKILARGSAHVLSQRNILRDEESRVGRSIEKPSEWTVQREIREYALADRIQVLSSFARRTFVEENVPMDKLFLNPLASDPAVFAPSAEVVSRRLVRIAEKKPLRVLYVGAMTYQKGMRDLVEVVRALSKENFEFRLVGPAAPETARDMAAIRHLAELSGKVDQSRLPEAYAWADIFLFPTLQDGFAVVLAQASTAGLPLLATENCGALDLIENGAVGWTLPIRNAGAFVERLRRCDANREEYLSTVKRASQPKPMRTWDDMAQEFEMHCADYLNEAGKRHIL